jgi:hypothetical protein
LYCTWLLLFCLPLLTCSQACMLLLPPVPSALLLLLACCCTCLTAAAVAIILLLPVTVASARLLLLLSSSNKCALPVRGVALPTEEAPAAATACWLHLRSPGHLQAGEGRPAAGAA